MRIFKNWDGETWWAFPFFLALNFAFVFGAVCAICAVRSDRKVDGCFIREMDLGSGFITYQVRGHIPWRDDVILAEAPNGLEAHEVMVEVCPVAMSR